jgi:plastocyanin
LTVVALCAALGVAAGCGESSSGGSSTTSGSGGASSSAASGAGGSTASGGSNSGDTSGSGSASAGASKGGKTSTSSGLKYNTTPKFAKPSASEAPRSGVVQVEYRNYAINPDTLRVKSGSTVRWTNYDEAKCNVTSEGGAEHFKSKDFDEGGTYEIKLTKPGIVHYECTYFPTTMNGSIEVIG